MEKVEKNVDEQNPCPERGNRKSSDRKESRQVIHNVVAFDRGDDPERNTDHERDQESEKSEFQGSRHSCFEILHDRIPGII